MRTEARSDSESRMVLYRLKVILEHLRRWPGSLPDWARELEVSQKTVHRDVELLRNLGLNLTYDRSMKGWLLVETDCACALCGGAVRRDAGFRLKR